MHKDIESAPSTSEPPFPPQQQTYAHGKEPGWWRKDLYVALREAKLDTIKQILDEAPEAINGPVDEVNSTPLVMAVAEGLGMSIIQELVGRMSREALAMPSESGATALHWAASNGNQEAAELLVSINPGLPNRHQTNGWFPAHSAAAGGHMKVTFYLINKTDEHRVRGEGFIKGLLNCAIFSGMLDLALHLLDDQNLELKRADVKKALEVLVELAFRNNPKLNMFPSISKLNMLESIIYFCIPKPVNLLENLQQQGWVKSEQVGEREGAVKQDIHSQGQSQSHSRVYQGLQKVRSRVFKMLGTTQKVKNIRALKLKHCQALELLNKTLDNSNLAKQRQNLANVFLLGPPFMLAIRKGIPEVVEKMLQVFPRLLQYSDTNEDKKTPLQLAAECRHDKIFQILHKSAQQHREYHQPFYFDASVYGDSFLHKVAKRPRRNPLGAGSRVVLQVQRELQWYKAAEQLMPNSLIFEENSDKKMPIEVFDEEHQEMVKSEGEWIISMSNSCIVGGSLIATVVFAAAITVPGGNKDEGLPNFSKDAAFKVFAFSDALALVSSLITVVTFLSIFTTRHSVNDFLYGLPNRLIIGLISLLLAVTFMMIAFSATVYLVFADNHRWIFYPTAALSCVSVIFFAYLQLPSVVHMIRSTYGHNILKQAGKMNSDTQDMGPRNSESTLTI